ncbi:MAG: T9SS type A sorting domain-containing protein [Bacteroidales bacterium]|nr:T9SS type A sorting domain-containing protein [Bacteroidales bacterium]
MKLFQLRILSIAFVSLISGVLNGQEQSSLLMKPVYSDAARAHDSLLASKIPLLEFPGIYQNRQLPAMVDNSQNDYWPGIQDQFLFYSCQQHTGVSYVYGYEINRLRDQPGWYWENRYPAHYTWNFMNQGERYVGVNFFQSFEVIRQQGHMTSDDYGQDTATSVLGWITGYDKYYRGMSNRLKQVYAIEVNSAAGINQLKNYLYDHLDGSLSGGIACFTTSSGTFYNMRILPAGTPEAGKHVIFQWQSDPVHGLTVIGYNDSIRFDVNNDGKFTNDIDITGDGFVDARDWETGAFRLANSYGGWWEDDGFVYAMYRSFALNYENGGVWNNRVYVVEPDSAYRPLLTVKVTLNYNARSKIRILAGVSSDTLDQLPRHVIDFPVFNFQGGEHAMQGYDTIPDAKSIEFGLDVTPLLNFIPSGLPAKYFIMVEERDPDHIGQGMVENVSFISYNTSPIEIPVKENSVIIKDNNTTVLSAVASFEKPGVQITTTSLPPWSAAQPVHLQLEAAGGQPPYDWSFIEEYIKAPVNTPEPLISGTSIQVHHETRSFATVALPFSFPFFGKRYDSIYVNYFGFIAFEPQNLPAPYITDEMSMLRMFPLIVPSFSQQYSYQFTKNDGIWFQADATHAIIRWKVSVSPYVTSSIDDFAVILYPDGRFEFCYGAMDNLGFTHTFYKGISKGDELNFDIQTQWDANEISGKSYLYHPPLVPDGLSLSREGMLSVDDADSTIIYGLHVQVADARRISDSKVLMLSGGLDIVHELICGNDDRLKSGCLASMKLILTNKSSQPIQNLTVKIRAADSLVIISDSSLTIPILNPGQSLEIPSAFAFSLRHALPNEFPVMMTLQALSGNRYWNKELLFQVAAPEIKVETPYVSDGYDNRLEPGEVADLYVNLKNSGGLGAQNLLLKLVSNDQMITVLSAPVIPIDQLEVFSSNEYRFQVKASRDTESGTEVSMQMLLSDSSGVLKALDFSLPVGTKPVAVVNLAVSKASGKAMMSALDSLNVTYDTISELPFDYARYASIFLILGAGSSGTHVLTDSEGATLAAYLQNGGNLYMESYYTWYYHTKTPVHAMFKYTSTKIPAYFFPDVKGVPETFTDSMSFVYTAPMSYAVFSFVPTAPAYSTFVNTSNPPKNLEVAYHGDDYKTIGTMLDFSALDGGSPPSTQTTLMRRYLDFFDLNISGPYPLFHAGITTVCQGQTVPFADDSFDNITLRSWEFQGGVPATSTEKDPVVRYDESGKFDVKLTVSDGVHTRTILKKKYIQAGNCSGTYDLVADQPLFRIFPNPTSGQITIELTRNINGKCKIMLFDLTGIRLMETLQIIPSGNQMIMDLSGLGRGLYFLRVQVKEQVSTMKVIRN